MVTLITAARHPRAEDVAWFRADGSSMPGAVRRAAVALAERLALPPSRAAEIGLALTEVAENLVRHADEGSVLLRTLRWPAADEPGDRPSPPAAIESVAIEFVAIDSGPGLADVPAAMRDGTTSAGTLGIGLGMIERLADRFDIYSTPGMGTVMTGAFGPRHAGGQATPDLRAAPRVAGLTRPITGETVCGDAYAVRTLDGRLALLSCDGLGHGELAARAADAAVRIFRAAGPPLDPVDLVRRVHSGISHTRGAAVAVAVLEPSAGTLRFAGLGNISGVILGGARRVGLTSRPGIAGHQARSLAETRHELPPGALVVLHSDGISPRWDLADHPGIVSRGALVVAASVLRDAGLRRDDASVLVAGAPWV
ncbi:ATP-binding protein [Frankia sp. CNm7]|uniref:ATP-binding protein n=1 Tax=Frankia nepalensis TaxID=1836974 RepID=A0A937RL79_9ACTN|nr:ATP-binding protein [Frankia nepalensis]MBL7497882.1 ATP-binding protein [Frankia nepalensis]MBL7514379.1 ATP-binding protein [Frankia nepalensis]MBL7523320.1 ATP-binding protein [Frankia nepalensis]MBL7628463.1 ATP-binding protein [Frankia nepalensis]